MQRGSAAGVLVEREFCSNPPQNPQKGGYIHLVLFLGDIACRRLSCQEGVAAGFGRGSAAQNRGLGGDVRLKSGG